MVAARILEGQAALVTGGSRGIGRAIAVTLADAGASVMLTYEKNGGLATQVVGEVERCGGRAQSVQLSLASRESVRRAVEHTRESFGALDILVNNAAVAQEKPFENITDEDWDRVLACNLRGAFSACQEALPGMIASGFGRIINIASVGGQWGGFKQVHYAASKAGVISLTMSLARLFSNRGVTCNAVSPGLVMTDMASDAIASERERGSIQDIPVGRVATAAEIAEVVLFLSSKAASYVTGQTINVNGGMYFG